MTDGLTALGMFQASCCDSIELVALKSLARFDESTGNQTFERLLHFVLGHSRRKPYLCGIRCIFWWDCRQHTFLVARQEGSFVTRAHHDP